MRRIWWKALLATSLCLNVGFLAAFGFHLVQHRRPKGMSDLHLSPEVRARMESNFKSFKTRLGELNGELRTQRVAMLDLLASDQASPEAVQAQQARIMDVSARILETTDTHLLAQKALLTPAQQKLFFDHIRHRVQDPDRRSPFP